MPKSKNNKSFHIRIKVTPQFPLKHFYLKGICVASKAVDARIKVLSFIKEWAETESQMENAKYEILEVKLLTTDFMLYASN